MYIYIYTYIYLEAQVPIVEPWVTETINFYRDLRTGTQYIGNWA